MDINKAFHLAIMARTSKSKKAKRDFIERSGLKTSTAYSVLKPDMNHGFTLPTSQDCATGAGVKLSTLIKEAEKIMEEANGE